MPGCASRQTPTLSVNVDSIGSCCKKKTDKKCVYSKYITRLLPTLDGSGQCRFVEGLIANAFHFNSTGSLDRF